MTEHDLGKVGLIARFKPLHIGGAAMLEAVCERSDSVIIGIGSANKYNVRSPFTADESEAMVRAFLGDRYSNFDVVHVPDSGHLPGGEDGALWKAEITKLYGPLDAFITGNPYVADLLKDTYHIVHPVSLIDSDKQLPICATDVRTLMAQGSEWDRLVPGAVATYIRDNRLDERFRKEFGLETLATAAFTSRYTTAEDERVNVQYR